MVRLRSGRGVSGAAKSAGAGGAAGAGESSVTRGTTPRRWGFKRTQRAAAIGLTVLLASALGAYGAAVAGADPKPTIDQVQAKVNQLQSKVDQVGAQYDQVTQQMQGAESKLNAVKRRVGKSEQEYLAARNALRLDAIAAYEDSGQSSFAGLLSSDNPEKVLRSAALLAELANIHDAQANRFVAAAQQVAAAQAEFSRTTAGIAQIQSQLAAKKQSLNKLLSQSQSVLNGLNLKQQEAVASLGGGTCHASDPYGASSPGLTAVQFAYSALCLPYLWGGTGPSAYDCSGLTQAAWQHAGVSIPRDTYSQWGALPHVSKSELQPGDLVFFEGEGHVGIYVGGGLMIDAPATGQVVTLHALDEEWYAANYVGAARP